jgi:hypothetical protein
MLLNSTFAVSAELHPSSGRSHVAHQRQIPPLRLKRRIKRRTGNPKSSLS